MGDTDQGRDGIASRDEPRAITGCKSHHFRAEETDQEIREGDDQTDDDEIKTAPRQAGEELRSDSHAERIHEQHQENILDKPWNFVRDPEQRTGGQGDDDAHQQGPRCRSEAYACYLDAADRIPQRQGQENESERVLAQIVENKTQEALGLFFRLGGLRIFFGCIRRVSVIGRREGIPDDVLREMDKTLQMSRDKTGLHVCLAINYGARDELLDAVRRIARRVETGELKADDLTEEAMVSHLYTAGMPDPDLLIRTAGEMRLSNFLLWQISYAEIWVTQACWPEFDREHLYQAIRDFAARDRRFGGLND